MSYYKILEEKLINNFSPSFLKIIDETHKHIGHAGNNNGAETHFKVIVVSDYFKDIPRVKRHREIYNLLDKELKDNIHALALEVYTIAEWLRKSQN